MTMERFASDPSGGVSQYMPLVGGVTDPLASCTLIGLTLSHNHARVWRVRGDGGSETGTAGGVGGTDVDTFRPPTEYPIAVGKISVPPAALGRSDRRGRGSGVGGKGGQGFASAFEYVGLYLFPDAAAITARAPPAAGTPRAAGVGGGTAAPHLRQSP